MRYLLQGERALAPRNMFVMLVTDAMFHDEISWSKASQFPNALSIRVTAETSQLFKFELNAEHPWNIVNMSVFLETSHCERS
eukprot:1481210-Prymnesium_polylepis.2